MRLPGLRPLLYLLAWGAVSSLGAIAAPAQDDSESFSEAIDVRVVNVDVFVTDRKGRFVEGLSKEDFILEVDGKEREIGYFRAVGEAAAVRTVEGSVGNESAPALASPEPEAQAEDELVHLVVYLDDLHLQPAHAHRVRDDLRRFAEAQSERGVRVMLVSFDTGTRVRFRFTDSAAEVRAGFEAFEEASSLGLQSVVGHRSALRGIEGLYRANECDDGALCPCPDPCDCAWSQMLSLRDQYASEVSRRYAGFRSGLSEIIGALGGVPGRKALVYVSSGLEQYPGLDLLQYMSDLCPEYESEFKATATYYDTNSALTDLTAGANANRVTLYALGAAGLEATGLSSVEYADRKFRPSAQVDSIRRSNLESSLFVLADETGGRAIFNANQPYAALDEAASDFSRYYSLAFEPPGTPDGAVHLIRVKLRHQGTKTSLRHRRSYREKPLGERQAERTLTALHGGLGDNPLGVRVDLGATEAVSKKRYKLPVEITLPGDSLRSLSAGAASLHVTLIAQDLTSGNADLREKELTVSPLAVGETDHLLVVDLELPPGPYRCAVGIRDQASGTASYLSFDAVVPSDAE